MSEPERISAEVVYREVTQGAALLVCAYDDDEKFRNLHLEGAVSLADFKAKLPELDRGREIFFYCA
jgi:hypothetical protein